MNDEPGDDRIEEVSDAIGVDFQWLLPTDQRHFDPMSAIDAYSMLLLLTFFQSFGNEVRLGVGNLGRWVADRLGTAVADAVSGKRPVSRSELREACAAARGTAATMPPPDVLRTADAFTAALEAYLLGQGMPPRVARKVAAQLRRSALGSMGAPSSL